MNPQRVRAFSAALLIGLIGLCVLWEGWLAPLRPGGSWMILKALPLVFAFGGVLRGRRYTYQWLSMLVLLYLTEGIVRSFDPGWSGVLALVEALLAVMLFVSVVLYARLTAPSRSEHREG